MPTVPVMRRPRSFATARARISSMSVRFAPRLSARTIASDSPRSSPVSAMMPLTRSSLAAATVRKAQAV